ncbi:unnamed protein product [Blumeria hordei]|uniref:Yeast cell wall synthesis Kre9/Knh1-like N-terminal domain-containing protein n=1 Tax=Blumeria hordei TaxID=2867405 RepID=A0A383UZS1_BLUHO|nr:unnamed protein product [Blumeria hordei]
MQTFGAVFVAALIALSEAARLTNTADQYSDVKAGQPYKITWENAAGPVTILLKNGPSTHLQTVSTIASGQTGNSYEWTPPSTLKTDKYAFEITDSGEPNYSVQFTITGDDTPDPMTSSQPILATGTGYPVPSGMSSYTSRVSNATSTMTGTYPTGSGGYSGGPSNTTVPHVSSTYMTSTIAASPSSTTVPADANNANGISSPLALVLSTFFAFIFLH